MQAVLPKVRLEETFERKLFKYAGLVSNCQQVRWRARAFSNLGIEGERKRRFIHSTTDVAERASRWLWLKREESWSHK
ncbi:hypothetical protein N1851_020634 [Merluccius polli]|uniref:Uncharacterized protein n=1 Tax=Merluccius polli TaxID=89951 RepID=A0AA47MKD9_MERPO|nr:hypothetical protein N1851_020634 [Merluccius polli]